MASVLTRFGAAAVAIGLAVEVFMNVPWIGRILSMGVVYDGTVFLMVGLRAAVTALQTSAAWTLWQGLPAGSRFGQAALVASAVLRIFEVGLRLSPSSVPPGLRWPTVIAYAAYAAVGIWLLRSVRTDR